MKHRLLFIPFLTLLIVTSCKKEKQNPIVGTWADYYSESLTFYSNGRGVLKVSSGPSPFSWHESGSTLEIDYDDGYYNVWTIRISNSVMTFFDNNGNTISWDKQ